jgi:4-hydroxy-tetrahydrodipicolinate synthase
MLYNVPSRAGVALHPEALQHLRGHRNLWAVKEAGGDPRRFTQWQQEFPEIAWYSGDDALIGAHAASGAAGLVSVASNIWPARVQQLLQRCINGDAAAAELMRTIAEPLFIAANPIPSKALLKALGRIDSAELRLPLSAADLPSLEPLLAAERAVQQFFAAKAA